MKPEGGNDHFTQLLGVFRKLDLKSFLSIILDFLRKIADIRHLESSLGRQIERETAVWIGHSALARAFDQDVGTYNRLTAFILYGACYPAGSVLLHTDHIFAVVQYDLFVNDRVGDIGVFK